MTIRQKTVKSVLSAVLAVCVLLTAALPAFAAPSVISGNAVLIDSTTGQVLFAKDMDAAIAPSGLVKLMTALIAVESGTSLSEKLTVTSSALEPLGTGYRSMDLVAGEQIPLEDCLYGMILNSANDAANVIAESLGGSLDAFVEKMNAKAAELGLEHTTFVNPNGLTEAGQTTTCYDMALILRYALSVQEFSRIFGTQECTILPTNYTTDPRTYKTRCLLNRSDSTQYYFDGILGGVVGYTSDGGYITASAAAKSGRTVIAVVAKAESEENAYSDSANLLTFGFDNFTEVTFSGSDFKSGAIPVTERGVKVGEVVFEVASDTITILLSADQSADNVEAVAESLPSYVEKDSNEQFRADICYREDDGSYTVLLANVPLTGTVKLDSAETTGTEATTAGSIMTDSEGNPVTDESGRVVTGDTAATTEGSGSGGGFKRFLLQLLKVVLIIIAVFAGAVVLFILALVVIKYVRRYKKRKARARAAAERSLRSQNRNNDLY
ncbi:MAG: D-alanyl-D-alanine carboxypeptidase [Oscillospiraceae bacterium]|jgi:D-alanyl-D-alanine carboxypeptidase|nr:D-alanyl-D-alanine carboxypeptidase [Oscillospiraceae bacterium]